MSGFEIAGVVLGAWPILDQSLTFYKTRSEDIFRHEQVMNEMIRKLHLEHARFRNSCEKLVFGLVEDGEMDALLENPTERAWEKSLQAGLEDGLKSRLGRDFFAYTKTMRFIALNLLALRDIVGVEDPAKKDSWRSTTEYRANPKWHAKTWKKIKDCLNHDKHTRLLADIDKNNTYLERLTPGVLEAEAEGATKAKAVDISGWESVRRSAKSLYCAICTGWLCQCHSQVAHSARLRLEDQVTTKARRPRFGVSFSYRAGGEVCWQETEVEPEDEDEAEGTLAPRCPKIAFAQTTSPAPAAPSQKRISDLCTELSSCPRSPAGECIGFVLEKRRKHYIHLVGSTLRAPTGTISLYELLHRDLRNPSPRIRLVDRYRLACILATSLLQLHTTSWLGSRWTSRDIHIAPTATDMRLGECAFICSSFTSGAMVDNGPAHGEHRAAVRKLAVRNEAIFALGVMLLELSISAPLQSRQTDEDRALGELADCETAHRTAKLEKDDNLQEWNSAVRKCLECDFGEESDFENKKFRQKFYEGVVAPLQLLYEMTGYSGS